MRTHDDDGDGVAQDGGHFSNNKALANEEGHIVADTLLPTVTNVSPFVRARNIVTPAKTRLNVSDFIQKHFVFATNVSQFA